MVARNCRVRGGNGSQLVEVLIHAAAGGVGLVAIQYAKYVGAEVLATAGAEELRLGIDSLQLGDCPDSNDFHVGCICWLNMLVSYVAK